MRGRRRHVSSVLADALAARGGARSASVLAAFAEAIGPRLAREVSARGQLRDGRLLVVVSSAEWAAQVTSLEPEIMARLGERLGKSCPSGLSVHVGAVGP
jgi:predicted nucleic acid-binding Zn ribbon protein